MDNATGQWVSVDNAPYGGSADHLVPSRYRWWARDDWEEVCLNTHILTLGGDVP